MMEFITVTSQGQITIPAAFRRAMGIDKKKKIVIAKLEDKKMIIQPEDDIMSLAGSLHHLAKKGKSIDQIMKEEEEAVGEAIVEDYLKSIKK